ncbi:MAG: cyclic pyranopterin monophosphate synthase MoaC [Clostridiaceae bacterium]
MEKSFTHFDPEGNAIMVDVSEKEVTSRTAIASGTIKVNTEIMDAIINQKIKKGDVLGVARIAGIMGVKNTSTLIPLCHTLLIQKCSIDFELDEKRNEIKAICMVKTDGKTGVEMEALTGVTVTLLTIYDMCKAIDKGMELGDIHLVRKSGGKSGDFFFDGKE